MTSHLDDGTIHELIDGEIASTALGPIRDHLAACECSGRIGTVHREPQRIFRLTARSSCLEQCC